MDVWNCPRCNGSAARSRGIDGQPPAIDEKTKLPVYFCRPCNRPFSAIQPPMLEGAPMVPKADIDDDNKDKIIKH